MTFEEFKAEADKACEKVCGYTTDDLKDAPWYDFYRDTGGEASFADFVEFMGQHDSLFRSCYIESKQEGWL